MSHFSLFFRCAITLTCLSVVMSSLPLPSSPSPPTLYRDSSTINSYSQIYLDTGMWLIVVHSSGHICICVVFFGQILTLALCVQIILDLIYTVYTLYETELYNSCPYAFRLLTLKLGVLSSSHIHLSSGLGGDSGCCDGIWAFLKFTDVSPQEASTIMLGSFTQRYM